MTTDQQIESIPSLTKVEQLTLQKILLHMQVENERLENYNLKISISKSRLGGLEEDLSDWNRKLGAKLKRFGLKISDISIDADTGIVSVLDSKVVQMLKANTAE